LNYSERLAATEQLFAIALKKLIQRIVPLKRGVKHVYGMELPFADPPTRRHL
jgi:hypothetical protein